MKEIFEHVRQVKAQHEERLLKLANVVGVGIGFKEVDQKPTDQVAIIVNVTEKKPLSTLDAKDVVPPKLDGVPTDVQETGQFKAQ